MKLLLDCYSSNPEYSCGCDWAIVDLTPQLAERLIGLIERLNAIQQQDSRLRLHLRLHEMYYFGAVAQYFAPNIEDEGLEAILESGDVPDDYEIPEACIARTECDQIVVRSDAVEFFCYAGGIQITTEEISLETLQQTCEAKAARNG